MVRGFSDRLCSRSITWESVDLCGPHPCYHENTIFMTGGSSGGQDALNNRRMGVHFTTGCGKDWETDDTLIYGLMNWGLHALLGASRFTHAVTLYQV